jgi:predicted transcriptional regulator
MPRVSQHPKAETFNFRINPALKAAFTRVTEAEDKPAVQVLRDFMRAYVERQKRKAFEIRRGDNHARPRLGRAIRRAMKRRFSRSWKPCSTKTPSRTSGRHEARRPGEVCCQWRSW